MNIRDTYCTPRKIARRLPLVDLDPCSNPRSIIKARRTCMRERGENGLLVPWDGLSVFVNPPWSRIKPFARKAWEADSFCFLVLEDASTEWWEILTQFPCFRFSFNERIPFDAPPGVDTSSNDRPTCMIADPKMRAAIGNAFDKLGRWWKSD